MSKTVPDDERTGGRYGLTVEPLTPELARRLEMASTTTGVVVSDVDPDGPGAEAGLQPGDVIVQVDRKAVKDAAQLRATLDQATSQRPALLLVRRQNGGSVFLTLAARG